MILDAWAKASGIPFDDRRYGSVATIPYRGRNFILLKPSTYMNRSGNAISYWLKKEKIPTDKMLVLVDDISLPLGSIRLRPKGGDGGHNGLTSINQALGHSDYARLRFGIGNDFPRGAQVNFVLGEWDKEESDYISGRIDLAVEMIQSFGFAGLELTMTRYNKEGRISDDEKQ